MTVRRGEAFCELLERICARDLPTAGGGDATVAVTLSLEALLGRLSETALGSGPGAGTGPGDGAAAGAGLGSGVARLDTGARISAAQARRLACGHRLVPAVLGSDSEVLDLGRQVRLHTKKQRLALAMCHAHHDQPWLTGGRTDLANGRLLCGPHHRRIHDPAYWHETLPDGTVRFHRRT